MFIPRRLGPGVGIGVAQGLWTPASLVQPGDQWLWADLDAAGAVGLAASPATGVWTPSAAALSNPSSGVLRVTQDGTAVNAFAQNATVYTAGHRILLSVPVRGDGFASTRAFDGAGFFFDDFPAAAAVSWTIKRGERTVPANSLRLYSTINPSAAGRYIDYDLNTWVHKNLSTNLITCKGNLGNLAQATAAQMPWSSDADAPTSVPVNGKRVLYFDGVADKIQRGFAAAVAQPWHIYCVARIRTDTASATLFDGAAGNDCRLFRSDANTLRMWAGAAGPTIPYVGGNVEIYECAFAGASSFATVNGGAKQLGNPGAANVSGVTLGGFGSATAAFMHCDHLFYFGINRILTDPERAKMNAYLRSYYALP